MIEVHLDGAKELSRGLKVAARDFDDLTPAQREAAKYALPLARNMAPRGPTGQLAGTLRNGKDGSIESPLPYAAPIHWGWQARSIEPNMFILEAMRKSEPQWLKSFEKLSQEALDKV